jgi:hypothetical protein
MHYYLLGGIYPAGNLRRNDAHDLVALVSRPGEMHVDENGMKVVVD